MSHHESAARGIDARMVDRLLFFSDAVFAIVLTILVLELRPPEGSDLSDAAFWTGLAGMWRKFLAYFVSFALVSLWWNVHLRVTRSLGVFDPPTVLCNFAFLCFIALIPFVAALWGQNIATPAAMVAYWSENAAVSLSMTLLYLVSTRGRGKLLVRPLEPGERASRLLQSITPACAFVAGALLAANGHVEWSWNCWVIIPIMGIITRGFRGKPKPRAPA
jgi:TMEM175 potassium channel family protein